MQSQIDMWHSLLSPKIRVFACIYPCCCRRCNDDLGGSCALRAGGVWGEEDQMTWQHIIGSNSLVEIKPTWVVLVGQF